MCALTSAAGQRIPWFIAMDKVVTLPYIKVRCSTRILTRFF